MPITKGYQQLVAEAMAEVKTYSVAEVRARLNDADVQVVDIRDIRDIHIPRLHEDLPIPYHERPMYGVATTQAACN